MFRLPHSPGMVPSSMAVTMGEAIRWPSFPANSELPNATAWASRECPQASWKITPPKPPSITTGITPAGHGSACSMVTARLAAIRACSATSTRPSNSSKPIIAPGDALPDWLSPLPSATAEQAMRVYTRRSPVNSPSLLAISTSLSQ